MQSILQILISFVFLYSVTSSAKQFTWSSTDGKRKLSYKSDASNKALDPAKCGPFFEMMKSPEVKSLGMVVKNSKGKRLFESYDLSTKRFNSKSRANVFSISKFTTLGVFGVLAKSGAPHVPGLKLNMNLEKCMPNFGKGKQPNRGKIRIKDLLSHTSGIEFCELEDCNATDSLKMACTKDGRSDVIGYIENQKYDPGKRGKHYNYSSANYVLLEKCMEKMAKSAGKDYKQLKAKALKILGASDVSFGSAGSGKKRATMAGSEASMSVNSLFNLGENIIDNPTKHMSKEVADFIHKKNPGLCSLPAAEIQHHGATFSGFWGNVAKFCPGKAAKTRYFPEMEAEMKYVAGHGGTWYFSLPKQKIKIAILGANRSHGHLYKPFLRRASKCFGTYKGSDLGDWKKSAKSSPTAGGGGMDLKKLASLSDTILQKPLTNCHALFSCLCMHGNYHNDKKSCAEVGAKQFTLPDSIAGQNLLKMSSGVTGEYLKKLPQDLRDLVKRQIASGSSGTSISLNQSMDADSQSATSRLFLTLRRNSGQPKTIEFSRATATMRGESRQCEMTSFAERPTPEDIERAEEFLRGQQ